MTYGPDVDYVMNGAFEMLDIAPDLYVWVTQCPPAFDYNALMDDGGMIGRLEAIFSDWWGTAPLSQRLALLRGVHRSVLPDQLRMAAEFIAGRSVDRALAAILGLPERAHLQIPAVLMLNGATRDFEHRKVRRLTKRERASIAPEPLGAVAEVWAAKMQAMFDRFSATLREAQGRNLVALADQGENEFRQGRHNLHIRDELIDRRVQERLRSEHATHKIGRKVLKRSMKLMDRMIGEGSTGIFFSKQSLTFTGQKYQFEVSKKDGLNLISNAAQPHMFGSIPYVLNLRALDGTYLAQGCVVFPESPALDQIVALFLTIKAGKEEEIVSKTNWFNCAPQFRPPMTPAVMRYNRRQRHRRNGRKPVAVRAGRKLLRLHRELTQAMIPMVMREIRASLAPPVLVGPVQHFLAEMPRG